MRARLANDGSVRIECSREEHFELLKVLTEHARINNDQEVFTWSQNLKHLMVN